MRLKDKITLVTGAGSGIGRAVARELCARGACVILVGRRGGALRDTRRMLTRPGYSQIIEADITDADDREAIVRQVSAIGGLDLLVNNAGVVVSGPFGFDDGEARRRMVETNLLGPMELTQALLPALRMKAPSRVVNVGSMFGDIAFPYFAAYSATKFALRGWSDALRRELGPYGIGVTYAAPRGTRTPAADSFAGWADAFDMALDPPEVTARAIVHAIETDARSVYPKGIERLFVLVQRLMPSVIDGTLDRQQAEALARMGSCDIPRVGAARP